MHLVYSSDLYPINASIERTQDGRQIDLIITDEMNPSGTKYDIEFIRVGEPVKRFYFFRKRSPVVVRSICLWFCDEIVFLVVFYAYAAYAMQLRLIYRTWISWGSMYWYTSIIIYGDLPFKISVILNVSVWIYRGTHFTVLCKAHSRSAWLLCSLTNNANTQGPRCRRRSTVQLVHPKMVWLLSLILFLIGLSVCECFVRLNASHWLEIRI